MEASLQSTSYSDIPSTDEKIFVPQEILDHPYDLTLVVEDGKEFKAHRRVLSEASPFFEKMLNSDMKESNEGVVVLEMLTEHYLRDILEFIYTGSVQILAEDNAKELIAMADYLVLPQLKTFAGRVLVQTLKASNAISTHHFAERFRCEQLISDTKDFIFANFLKVAKTGDFLNLSTKEVIMWISSDEIDVGSEEDVFKLILRWIDREKSERKKYFAEMFREVRLVYVSRDFLLSDIVTNDLVTDNEDCMDLVKDAVKLIDSEGYDHLSVKPRNSLKIPVILIYIYMQRAGDGQILCYNPQEDMWSKIPGKLPCAVTRTECPVSYVVSCHGKLFFICHPNGSLERRSLLCYDSFSNCWTTLPFNEQWDRYHLFDRNEDEIYALVCTDERAGNRYLRSHGENLPSGKRGLSLLKKYKRESNTWEDTSSFDLGSREGICVVANDNFIYFLGGEAKDRHECLTDADRYDFSTNAWDKIADLQEPRCYADGAAAHGKIFIIGGMNPYSSEHCTGSKSCEVFHEATNEWQYIAKPAIERMPFFNKTQLYADGKLYVLSRFVSQKSRESRIIECYDPDNDKWIEKTVIPFHTKAPSYPEFSWFDHKVFCCPMTILKGCDFHQNAFPDKSDKVDKCKCAIT